MYDPQKEECETAKWQLKARMGKRSPLEGPLFCWMIFIFKRPKTNKNKFHTTKPDVDNLTKWILDVGNKILWLDDKQIVATSATKIYGTEPKTLIVVGKFNGDNSR
jgi:Holliday junction resolvase RusA-like endonuclease